MKERQDAPIPVTNRSRQLATRLLTVESASVKSRGSESDVRFWVFEKIQQPLISFAGAMGFQALISRALTLTKAEMPGLSPVSIGQHGTLERLADIKPRLNAEQAADGEVLLIGNLVDLLCTFLGEAVVLRLIQDVWPGVSFEEKGDGKGTEA